MENLSSLVLSSYCCSHDREMGIFGRYLEQICYKEDPPETVRPNALVLLSKTAFRERKLLATGNKAQYQAAGALEGGKLYPLVV
jgi:hypothetical protein